MRKQKIYGLLTLILLCLLFLSPGKVLAKENTTPIVQYQAHLTNHTWQPMVINGSKAGLKKKKPQIDALRMVLRDKNNKNRITYRVKPIHTGWTSWKKSGKTAGTRDSSNGIEAIQVKLCGKYALKYDVYYRVYIPGRGWLGWTKNGKSSGTGKGNLTISAFQVRLVPKGQILPSTGKAYIDASKYSVKGISLKHYMTDSINQMDYEEFLEPYGYNAGCCATVYATGLSIVNKQNYNPTTFWRDGLTYYDEGGLDAYEPMDIEKLYHQLEKGKPAMLKLYYGSSGQHYLLVIGICPDANIRHFDEKELLIIDPASGTKMKLEDNTYYQRGTIDSMRFFL